MNLKTNIVIGQDAEGNQKAIYVGEHAAAAKEIFESVANGHLLVPGVTKVGLFRRLRSEKARDVVAPATPEPESAPEADSAEAALAPEDKPKRKRSK
jgi:hypothetical protein